MASPRSPREHGRARRLGVLFAGFALAAFACVNVGAARFRFQGQELPAYGTWTGIVTLEAKLQRLRAFARQGPVDAVILGSSIGDFGLSAERLTRDLSAARGTSFRVFNFSVGGVEATTYPTLYRLARQVADPREVWLVYPVTQNIGDVRPDNSPDQTMLRAPLGTALRWPALLPLSFEFFDLPVVRHAGALRDLATYGRFVNRPSTHADVYEITTYGDSHSFSYFSDPQVFEAQRTLRRASVLDLARQYATPGLDDEQRRKVYLSDSHLARLLEMRALADRDDCKVTIVPHDRAAGLFMQDAEYIDASRSFYTLVGQRVGASVADVRSSFVPRHYKVSDPQHLNIVGAAEFSTLLAARLANQPLPSSVEFDAARELIDGLPMPKATNQTALVTRGRRDPTTTLQARYLQNWSLPRLQPGSPVRLAVQLPDGRAAVIPARVLPGGSVLADTSTLTLPPNDVILLTQLVPRGSTWGSGMNVPLASFQWSSERHQPEFFDETRVKVQAGAASYTPLDPIQASWSGIEQPKPRDWIGLFPVGGNDQTRITFVWTKGTASGTLVIPPTPSVPPGEYQLRLFANEGWQMLADSRPFTIAAPK